MESVSAISYFALVRVFQTRQIRTKCKLFIGRKHVHGECRLNLQLLPLQPCPLLWLVVLDGNIRMHCDGLARSGKATAIECYNVCAENIFGSVSCTGRCNILFES